MVRSGIGGSSERLSSKFVTGSKAFIFVRKALQVRPRDQQCICIAKLAEKDLRFSMKMMFAPVHETSLQPV
jgi:hypothetical protein